MGANCMTKDVEKPVKKGKKSWSPPKDRLTVKPIPGYRTRWCDKDESNIRNKTEQGWEIVDKVSGLPVEHDHKEIQDGSKLTSAVTYREGVLMALPEELGKQRDEWVATTTDQRTAGLKEGVERKVGGAAKITGKIVIE